MESEGKVSVNNNNKSMERVEMIRRKGRVCDMVVRVVALALTLLAAIILGVDKQTKLVPIKLLDSLPPLNVPVTAKWHYLSAFVYFVVTNAIACAYAALSLVVGLAKRGNLGTMIIMLDALMVALLFSGNGAAMAIGLVGLQGNSHVQWNKVCNVFGKFCDQVKAALAFSLLGSTAFLLLLVLPLSRLHTTN